MATLASDQLQTNGQAAGIPRDHIWRLTPDQYHRMIDQGILTDADPVELLEGWLVQKMPKKPMHRLVSRRTRKALEKVIGDDWFVDCQEPIALEDSEPEPDISVIQGSDEDFQERHPTAAETGMLVEVSDATLKRDQGVKKRVYARAKIPVYWIVNIPEERVEVYSQSTGPTSRPTYRARQDYHPGEQVPVVLNGKRVGTIAVARLFA